MATVKPYYSKNGEEILSWRVKLCLGRDSENRQVFRTTTIKHPKGLSKKRAKEEADKQISLWIEEQRELYEAQKKQEAEQTKKKSAEEKLATPLSTFIQTKWIPNHVNNGKHKPTTISFYQFMADDICSYFGEKRTLEDIDDDAIEEYEKYLRTRAKTKNGKPISETNVRRHLETLRNILTYARKKKYIKENPFDDYPIETVKKQKKVDYLREDEIKLFFDCLDETEKKTIVKDGQEIVIDEHCVKTMWRVYVRISIVQGLRRGEMLGLRWKDVDWDNNLLLVRNNITVDQNSEEGYSANTTKSGEERISTFGERIKEKLLEYYAEQKEKYGTIKGSYYVFCRDGNPERPLYPTTPTTWLRRFEIENNLRHVSPHDFRHTAGTYLRKLGHNDRDIQDHLGHSDSKVANKYYVAEVVDLMRKSSDDLEKYFGELIGSDSATEEAPR